MVRTKVVAGELRGFSRLALATKGERRQREVGLGRLLGRWEQGLVWGSRGQD